MNGDAGVWNEGSTRSLSSRSSLSFHVVDFLDSNQLAYSLHSSSLTPSSHLHSKNSLQQSAHSLSRDLAG